MHTLKVLRVYNYPYLIAIASYHKDRVKKKCQLLAYYQKMSAFTVLYNIFQKYDNNHKMHKN